MAHDFDLFVIGAGSGGVRAARMSAAFGAKVAVAEERYLGGTCVNVGCIPKKLFVYGSHFGEDLEDARAYGWTTGSKSFKWDVLRNNKDHEIDRLNGVYRNLLESNGVTIFESHAEIVDLHTIKVGSKEVTAENILVATGSWPTVPDMPGKEHVVTSNEMFYLDTLPNKAIVIGGGYIAIEFAGILHGLGVETTVLYRRSLFLRGFDLQVREFVRDELKTKGVNVVFDASVVAVHQVDGATQVVTSSGEMHAADLVLSATGRAPLTGACGLESVGVELDGNGAIIVNDQYRSNVPNIFALGDVIDRKQLTPVAIKEAMCLSANLFNGQRSNMSYDDIPTAVFCQPNIGTVGPTEEEARERYSRIRVYESIFRPLKHTVSHRNERSYMKLLVDEDSDRVVAAHMVGSDAGETIQGLGVAIKAGATKKQFDQTVGIHPTAAEEFVTMRDPVR